MTALWSLIMGSKLGRAILRYAAVALTVTLFMLNLRKSGERAGRAAERLENTERVNEIRSEQLRAAADRPRDRSELSRRLRNGRF